MPKSLKQITIIGGGPIGLTLGLLLLKKGLEVTIIDKGLSKESDGRLLALSHSSIELFNELGVWSDAFATNIDTVHISHKGLGVSKIVASDLELDWLGATIKYVDICKNLEDKVFSNPNCQFIKGHVTSITNQNDSATVTYKVDEEENILMSSLIILAEGGNIAIEGVETFYHDYQQTAVIATLKLATKTRGVAYERFGDDNALVLLPYKQDYKLVWSLDNPDAANITPSQLELKLKKLNFMQRFGEFTVMENIHTFPLRLRYVKKRVFNNLILIGNSAQTLHPVSAQGLNLGLRDASVLTDIIINSINQSGFDLEKIKQYDQLRKWDAKIIIEFTHYLAQFVEIDHPLINHCRGLGIMALSNLKFVQNKVASTLVFGN